MSITVLADLGCGVDPGLFHVTVALALVRNTYELPYSDSTWFSSCVRHNYSQTISSHVETMGMYTR